MSRALPRSSGEILAEIAASRPGGEIFCNIISFERLGSDPTDDIESMVACWIKLRGLSELFAGCNTSYSAVCCAIRDIMTLRRGDEYSKIIKVTEKNAANTAKRFLALFAEPRGYAASWEDHGTNHQQWAMCWDAHACGIIVDRTIGK